MDKDCKRKTFQLTETDRSRQQLTEGEAGNRREASCLTLSHYQNCQSIPNDPQPVSQTIDDSVHMEAGTCAVVPIWQIYVAN